MASLSDILVTTASTDIVVARAIAPEVREYLTNQLRANFPFMEIGALKQLVEEMVQHMQKVIKKACPQMAESKVRSGFFDILPAEIRNRIYELALPEPRGRESPSGFKCEHEGDCIFLKSDEMSGLHDFEKFQRHDPYYSKNFDFSPGIIFSDISGRFPGMLHVCRQMREEVAPMYYGDKVVHVVIYDSQQNFMREWLKMIGKEQAAMIDEVHMEFYDQPLGHFLFWHNDSKRQTCRRKKYKPIRTKMGVLGIMGLLGLGVPVEKFKLRSERSWYDVEGTEVEELETLGEGLEG